MTRTINAPYEFINTPALKKAPENTKFIYVLMLNINESLPLRPYYVGQATSLVTRFNGHQQITWHKAKFNTPVKVWVAGIVDKDYADDAEQDLIEKLITAGYVLTNTHIADEFAKRIQSEKKMFSQDSKEIEKYLSKEINSSKVLPSWQRAWTKQALPLTKKVKPSLPKTSQDKIKISKQDILSYIKRSNFDSITRGLLLMIAQNYNQKNQSSVININGKNTGYFTKNEINSLNFFFITVDQVNPDKHIEFFLTKKVRERIIRNNNKY